MANEVKTQYFKAYDNGTSAVQRQWWLSDKDTLPYDVFGVVKNILDNQDYRSQNNLKYAALYSNYQMMGFYGAQFMTSNGMPGTRVTLNVVKSCIDTAAAKISKAKPRPLFLSDGGVWSQKRRAELLTQYMEGQFDYMDIYSKGQQAFIHGCVTGTGFLKFYKDYDKGQIQAEHVLTEEIVVDDNEALYGNPRQLHQKRYMSRDVLLAHFPKQKEFIAVANTGIQEGYTYQVADLILVIESWHLPSAKDSGDGKHTICIENQVLLEEDYIKDYFPFVWFTWSPRLVGFYGAGLAEELVGIQLEINKILRNIQIAQKLMSVPRIFMEANAGVNYSGMTNGFAEIYKYTGAKPVAETFQAMSSEIYTYLWELYAKAYEITGISQLSASSKKPSGLDSGVAIREYQDIESERFVLVGQRYEEMFIKAADIIVDMSKDFYEEEGKLSVNIKKGKFLKRINWKEVEIPKDDYVIRVFPTSNLPSTPAGKLQMIQELLQGGLIDKDVALNLLDYPDLEAYASLATAALDDISNCIEQMIDYGNYITPEPFMDLGHAISMTNSAYLRAKLEKVEEDRLELLRRFISDCQALLELANQPPEVNQAPAPSVPQVTAEGLPPQAVPEASPVSQLIPNIPQ